MTEALLSTRGLGLDYGRFTAVGKIDLDLSLIHI